MNKKLLIAASVLLLPFLLSSVFAQQGPNKPPVAKFKADDTSLKVGESTDFKDQTKFQPEQWFWFFEGGNSGTAEISDPEDIQYLQPGTYDVTLIVVNQFGSDTLTKYDYITVTLPELPEARFTAMKKNLVVGESTNFKDHSKNNPDTWSWTFGGGEPAFSSDEDPAGIVYHAAGTFDVRLIVENEAGADTLIKQDYIKVSEPLPPVADFIASDTLIDAGEDIEFTDLSSNCPHGWHWFFPGGEPAESVEKEPGDIHYSTPGTYDVTLIVWNDYGSDTLTKPGYITVTGEEEYPPVAAFEATSTNIEQGDGIEFIDLSENDPEGWQWYFDGGDPGTSTDQDPGEIFYNTPGTYDVTLIVWNDDGSDTLTKIAYITVTETGLPPVADFMASQTGIYAGESIDFTDLSQNDPSGWMWTFDGASPATSVLQHPSGITYNVPGSYSVGLVITNAWGADTLVIENYIQVMDNPGLNVDFVADKTLIDEGEVVHFTNMSTGDITGFQWQIDGATPSVSYQENPTVIFNLPGVYTVTLTVHSPDGDVTEVKEDYIQVTEVPVVLPPGWEYQATGTEHFIAISLLANPRVLGFPISAGDYIGVFYTDDAGQQVCGGAVEWSGVSSVGLVAYGDEPYLAGKEGFAAGEEFIWKIYSLSQQQEFAAVASYDMTLPNQGSFTPMGMSAVVDLAGGETFELVIPQGWSGISTPLVPVQQNMQQLLAPIQQDLILINNFSGINWPGAGLNTLLQWDNRTGYTIKMDNPVTLQLVGVPEQDLTFQVAAGWNYLPALSGCETGLTELLGQHTSDVVFVREVSGFNMFWPEYGINSLSTLMPGKAYLILATADFVVTFPECTTSAKPAGGSTENTIHLVRSWNAVQATGNAHTIAFTADALRELHPGDVAGVFTAEGRCAGMAAYNGKSMAIQAFGDDMTTGEKDGFGEGEILNFRISRSQSGIVEELTPQFDPEFDASGNFEASGVSVVTGLQLSGASAVSAENSNSVVIYPNPAQDFVHVGGAEKFGELTIFDMQGHVVKEMPLTQSKLLRIDCRTIRPGVYSLRLKSKSQTIVKRLIIN